MKFFEETTLEFSVGIPCQSPLDLYVAKSESYYTNTTLKLMVCAFKMYSIRVILMFSFIQTLSLIKRSVADAQPILL